MLVINKSDISVDPVGIDLLLLLLVLILVQPLELFLLTAQAMGHHVLLHFEGLFLL